MHPLTTLANWCSGEWISSPSDRTIDELAIDTRRINNPAEALFIAISTERRNGHDFITVAYKAGVRAFLVQQGVDATEYPEAAFILAKNTLAALQHIAAKHRAEYDIPIVGITGSNGKTVVKEWLAACLGEDHNIVRSPKSYNSQVGVPLSVWLLEPEAKLAVFEAGISQPGEMECLERIIRPTLGIFTNIGEAHGEGFMSERQKITEKLLLFRHTKELIYCKDYGTLHENILHFRNNVRRTDNPLKLFTWSQKTEADLRITSIQKEGKGSTITGRYDGQELSVHIPFTDAASIENAIHCWCAMIVLDIPDDSIAHRLLHLQPVAMRLELKSGINDCTIINDTYNSDVTSLFLALDYLAQQSQHVQHTVILSDMHGIGRPEGELYEEVAEAVSRRGVKRFIGIGPTLYRHKSLFRQHRKLRSIFFKSTHDFLKKFHLLTFSNEAILLKGARAFEFEQISTVLEEEVHQTVLSIDLSALTHNLNVFRSLVKPGVKIMAMVKAFSYGSGSYEIAHALQFAGIDYLAVAYADEGVALRKAGIKSPIMVMSPDAIAFDRMIAWKLEPEIFNLRSLEAFRSMARTLDVQHYPIHLKIDTGMHRLGFMPHEVDDLIAELTTATEVRVQSIFSHLAAAEDVKEDAFTRHQASILEMVSDKISDALGYAPIRHLCNSAGITRHPKLHYDMVRLGLGLYGIDGTELLEDELKQVGTLKTTIAQIKDIPAGETVGYNRRGGGGEPIRIATISIGYADGYPRALGHGVGHVLVHGQPAPLVGIVCMDMCMVDITHIAGVQEGDDAIVFSPELPIAQLAKWVGTIPYELMTGISQRVKRVYTNES